MLRKLSPDMNTFCVEKKPVPSLLSTERWWGVRKVRYKVTQEFLFDAWLLVMVLP